MSEDTHTFAANPNHDWSKDEKALKKTLSEQQEFTTDLQTLTENAINRLLRNADQRMCEAVQRQVLNEKDEFGKRFRDRLGSQVRLSGSVNPKVSSVEVTLLYDAPRTDSDVETSVKEWDGLKRLITVTRTNGQWAASKSSSETFHSDRTLALDAGLLKRFKNHRKLHSKMEKSLSVLESSMGITKSRGLDQEALKGVFAALRPKASACDESISTMQPDQDIEHVFFTVKNKEEEREEGTVTFVMSVICQRGENPPTTDVSVKWNSELGKWE